MDSTKQLQDKIMKLPATSKAQRGLLMMRDSQSAVENYLDGLLDYEELNETEQGMYKRYLALTSKIIDAKGNFKRKVLRDEHIALFNISEATFNRDMAMVNKRLGKLHDAELELDRFFLYEKAKKAIKLAEKEKDGSKMAKAIAVAKDVRGIDKKGEGGTIQADKIEQHINIMIADDMTRGVLDKLLQKNVSVLEYETTLEEILRIEEENLKKSQQIEKADYEEI
jgi:hypothetical protein